MNEKYGRAASTNEALPGGGGRASPLRTSKFSNSMKNRREVERHHHHRHQHPWRKKKSEEAAKLAINNFNYQDLPEVKEKSFLELKAIVDAADGPGDVIQAILCDNDALTPEAYAQGLARVGDCNLQLETPLMMALSAKQLAHAVLLIVRESAELYFCSLANQSAYQLINEPGLIDPTFQTEIGALVAILRKFSQVDFHFTQVTAGYEVNVKKGRFVISRKTPAHPSHALFTRHVGYGSQATISRVQTFSREAKVLEMCLITVRILRRQGIQKSIEEVEAALVQAATAENWTEPGKWRADLMLTVDPLVNAELAAYTNEQLFDACSIISMMNFVYLLEKKQQFLATSAPATPLLSIIGATFEQYAKWCALTFPKLFKVIESAIPSYIRRVDLAAKYSNRKEFPIIKTLVDKIDALANYKLKMIDRFDLKQDPRNVKDRAKVTELNVKRGDFVCLVRFKIDEDLDVNIRQRWGQVAAHEWSKEYQNWPVKLNKPELNELYTLSLGYPGDIGGMMNFWCNLLNNENINHELIVKMSEYLSINIDYNYNTLSPGTPSGLVTPRLDTDNVFLFPDKPNDKSKSQVVLDEKDIIVKCLDYIYPNFINLLTRAFGEFTCDKPILAKKEYFVFDQPNYFRHLMLVNQIQATFIHPNLLQLDSYWLEQRHGESVTRIVTNTKFCKGGTLEGYIANLNQYFESGAHHLGHFRSLHLCQQLWGAILHLQRHGLTHKDIKPSNVFIDRGDVRLGDFGLMNYPSVESGSPCYMPKDVHTFKGDVDLYAFAMILIEVFYQNGSLTVQLVRHTSLCWSTGTGDLYDLLNQAAGNDAFYQQLNRVIKYLCSSSGPKGQVHQFDESPIDEIDPGSFTAAADAESEVEHAEVADLLRWHDRVSVRPSLNLEKVSPFFKNDSFIMNYIGELINHIDRQMSSTTQNNEQKEKAVAYIQSIEDVLEAHIIMDGPVNARRLHDVIIERLNGDNAGLAGVTAEILKAAHNDKAKVILPGKNNSKYNSIAIVKKWPLIFILQSCRNMYAHFHQCNDAAKGEICAGDESQANRRKQLIRIYRSLFPFVGARFEMLERSMPVLVALMAKMSEHQPLLAALSNTVVHAPNGNPAFAPDEIQATFLVRLGDYLNILRYNDLDAALSLERQMCELDHERLHLDWREHLIALYRRYNPSFPENFKIKCKTTKMSDPTTGAQIEKPAPNSFLCMLDYFRNILVHLPLKDRLGGAKADRRKEVAISAAVDRFIATATTAAETADNAESLTAEQQQMSRGKMVLFFKHAFPGFINIVVTVVKAQPNFAFSNNSVFVTSSKIRRID